LLNPTNLLLRKWLLKGEKEEEEDRLTAVCLKERSVTYAC
jgi:hypothetical protein